MIKVILWDIDGTLLDFGASEQYALRECFKRLDLGSCTDEMIARYSAINRKYWERLECGLLTKQQVLVGRFQEFFAEEGLNVQKAEAFHREYQLRLGDKIFFHDNGAELVAELKSFVRQYAATNGTLIAQRRKLANSGLDKMLDGAFISDEIGVEKPMIGFFNFVFETLAKEHNYDKDEIMIVGDSLTSDMQGGNNAGIICCWYNPERKQNTKGLHIAYEIQHLNEVLDIVQKY